MHIEISAREIAGRITGMKTAAVAYAAYAACALAVLLWTGRPDEGAGWTWQLAIAGAAAIGVHAWLLWRGARTLAAAAAPMLPDGASLISLIRLLENSADGGDGWKSRLAVGAARSWRFVSGQWAPSPSLSGPVLRAVPPETVALEVREARKLEQKTQEHVAIEAGISVRTLRRIETHGLGACESLRAVRAVLGLNHEVRVVIPTAVPPLAALAMRRTKWLLAYFPFVISLGLLCDFLIRARGAAIAWHAGPGVSGEAAYLAAADAVLLFCVGCAACTEILAFAHRNRAQMWSTTAAAAAVSVLFASSLPLLGIRESVRWERAASATNLAAYHAVSDAILKQSAADPHFDKQRALREEAVPLLYRSLGIDASIAASEPDTELLIEKLRRARIARGGHDT